jgi:5-methyltetrahydrofolate--homocysteine methyltransferase
VIDGYWITEALRVGIEVQFREEDWARVEDAWTAWWAGELERQLVMIEDVAPPARASISGVFDLGVPASTFLLDRPVDELLDYYQVRLEARRYYGDAWPKWWPNFGPGIIAGFQGARVNATSDTTWFEPAEKVGIHQLNLVFDPENPWWQRVRELTRRAVERWGDRVNVGYADLGGNLDILVSLLTTERLLFDLCDQPQEVARLVGSLTGLWLRYYDELYALIEPAGRGTTPWAAIWSPVRCYMLQSDFAYMISPGMFERFVLPDLAACCEHLDHAFYHLDGKGQLAHLDLLLSLERLRGIQWIPGDGQPPPEAWLPMLQRIREAGKLCQLYVSPEGARIITRELGGQGFAFYIDQPMSRAEAEGFLKELLGEAHFARP